MTRLRHRSLALTAVLALAATVPACSGPQARGSVTILGPWTDAEGKAFQRVLREFEEDSGIHVDYQNARAASQVLLANVNAGTPPDIAVLSSPGELAAYIDEGLVHPLDKVLDERERAAFRPMWHLPQDAHVYTVPVKASLKGLIWFNPKHTQARPTTWADLLAHTRAMADAGRPPWCLGVADAPNSGWPGTDMMEDILARQYGPDVYQRWTSGALPWGQDSEVEKTWRTWGLIAGDSRYIHGGRRSALLTGFADAGQPMFTDPPGCFLESQASFAMTFYTHYRQGPQPAEHFDFFSVGTTPGQETSRPWTASADLAAMFNNTRQARELMRFLATDAQSVWPRIAGSGAFTVNENVDLDVYRDDVSRRIAGILRSADTLCFDASDVMPPAMRNAYNRAVLEYLSDPSGLDAVLYHLDQVRKGVAATDWLDLACGHP